MTSPPDPVPNNAGASKVSVDVASKSDVGQVRAANEDSCDFFHSADGARLLIVADGMGGHRGGATASQTTVAVVGEVFTESTSDPNQMSSSELLQRAIRLANERVYSMAQQDPALEGMGTTAVAFFLTPGLRGTVAHVGDSRAYRLRRGQLDPITVDHSVVAEMQRRGLITEEEAAVHPRRNEILRSVGVQPEVEIEVSDVDVAAGDRFLLCSDGLSGMVSDPEIEAILGQEAPNAAVESLVQLANERGGPDNITVQIVAIPVDAIIETDPDVTADVTLSEEAVDEIVSTRRSRAQRQLWMALIAAATLLVGAYLLWGGSDREPTPARENSPSRSEPETPANHGRDRTATPSFPGRSLPEESDTPPAQAVVQEDATAVPPSPPETRGIPRPDGLGNKTETDRLPARRGIPRQPNFN